MYDVMSEPQASDSGERVRMIIDTDDAVRQAIAIRAAKESRIQRRHVSKSEVATMLLREALAEEIEQVEGWEDDPPKKGKR